MDPNVTKQIQKLQTFNNPCDLLWRLLWFNLVGGSAPLSHSLIAPLPSEMGRE